jgi:hypothetical protein
MIAHSACKDIFTRSSGSPGIDATIGRWCKHLNTRSNSHYWAGGGGNDGNIVTSLPVECDSIAHGNLERSIFMTGLENKGRSAY